MLDNKNLIIDDAELDQVSGGAQGPKGNNKPIGTEECFCRNCNKNVKGNLYHGIPKPVCPQCRQFAYTEQKH